MNNTPKIDVMQKFLKGKTLVLGIIPSGVISADDQHTAPERTCPYLTCITEPKFI